MHTPNVRMYLMRVKYKKVLIKTLEDCLNKFMWNLKDRKIRSFIFRFEAGSLDDLI